MIANSSTCSDCMPQALQDLRDDMPQSNRSGKSSKPRIARLCRAAGPVRVPANRPVWSAEEAQLSAKRKNPRVPLLIKLPHQHGSVTYAAPLNTVLIHDLLIRWMQGTDPTLEGVRAFLDQNRLRFPVLRTTAP